MDWLHTIIDFVLHIEVHLDYIITYYHSWTYLFLFLIVFTETGLVIFPFLPGDSLLFAIGAFAARGSFDVVTISLTLLAAALLGDTVNYSVGKFIGPKIFTMDNSIFLNKKHLYKAHNFYEKYGLKTIIMARFVPIVRTFAPFVAGIGQMTYRNFISYSVIGACLWIFCFIPLGYYFGNLPYVQQNFKIVILAIMAISVMPALIELYREKMRSKEGAAHGGDL
jgi:membrane-associated protein